MISTRREKIIIPSATLAAEWIGLCDAFETASMNFARDKMTLGPFYAYNLKSAEADIKRAMNEGPAGVDITHSFTATNGLKHVISWVE